jgi:hypothetical protein
VIDRVKLRPKPESSSTHGISIDRALADRKLLGAALGDLSTWSTWIATVKAAYGCKLDADERVLFDAVADGRSPPTRKVRELVVVASRRSGKGRVGAALAVFEAVLIDHSAALSPGEVGVVAIVSPTLPQSAIMLDYIVGFLQASAVLAAEIKEVVGNEVRLHNGYVITCLASDYRSLRGRTVLLAILDEASFLRDELSRASDIETARAIMPGLHTTGGMMVVLSSPYRRAGLVFQRHRDFYGRDNTGCLVVSGPSTIFNPTLDATEIEAAREADPEAARSEWLGEFRSDLAMFLSEELIEQAIARGRPLEMPPMKVYVIRHSPIHPAAAEITSWSPSGTGRRMAISSAMRSAAERRRSTPRPLWPNSPSCSTITDYGKSLATITLPLGCKTRSRLKASNTRFPS